MSLMRYIKESNNMKTIEDLRDLGGELARSNRLDSNPREEYPISVETISDWVVLENPERFQRTYEFDNMKSAIFFFTELYKYQFEIQHHCKIIVDNLSVSVETYTHDFEGITYQDKKIKNMADELYADVTYFEDE